MSTVKKDEIGFIREQVTDTSLFRIFSTDEFNILMNYFELRTYDENTVLFHEGDRGDYLCVVVEGTIEIRKESLSSKQSVIAKFGRGSIVGEMAIIDQFPRSAAARVTPNSKLLVLTRDDFDRFLVEVPRLGNMMLKEIARILSQRLRRTSGRFSDIF
jgi:CRP-like cAMP-binding protein